MRLLFLYLTFGAGGSWPRPASLHLVLKLDAPDTAVEPRVSAWNASGALVTSPPIAFSPQPGNPTAPPGVWQFAAELPPLPEGSYSALAELGDTRSNRATFRVGLDGGVILEGPALHIAPINPSALDQRLGLPDEPDFLVCSTNTSSQPISLAESLFESHLIVDGQAFSHREATWDGAAEILPGDASCRLLSLDAYPAAVTALSPGVHELTIEFGGLRSAPLRVVVTHAAW